MFRLSTNLLRWSRHPALVELTRPSSRWHTRWQGNCFPVYNWSAFLEQYFVKVPNIKRYHHFRITKDKAGNLFFKEYLSSTEQSILLRNPAILLPSVPPVKLRPQGLYEERKQYLYREIRQFCKPETEELVTPAP